MISIAIITRTVIPTCTSQISAKGETRSRKLGAKHWKLPCYTSAPQGTIWMPQQHHWCCCFTKGAGAFIIRKVTPSDISLLKITLCAFVLVGIDFECTVLTAHNCSHYSHRNQQGQFRLNYVLLSLLFSRTKILLAKCK